jgi:uncharacterized membrane protein YozB (DUF420 family)
MTGLLGTRAVMQTDINLILQFVGLVLLLAGLVIRKRRVRWHLGVMAVASLLELATFLEFMGPVFFNNLTFFRTQLTMPMVMAFLIHAITGTVTMVLGFGLILAWATHASTTAPCYRRKRLMLLTASIWSVSVAFGVVGYFLAYVF